MSTMYMPQIDIYTLLSGLDGVNVRRMGGDHNVKVSDLPLITTLVIGNNPILTIDGEIGYQAISLQLDIWTLASTDADNLLVEVEEVLRGVGYRLDSSRDLPEQDLYRISCEFNLSK